MDRFVFTDSSDFQPGVVNLDIVFTAGTSGAVPTSLAGYTLASGIEGMALSGTGLYTITLTDGYVEFLGGTFSVEQATYDATHGQTGYPVDADVTEDPATVAFQCVNPGTGAATAVTSGDIVRINLRLQRLTSV